MARFAVSVFGRDRPGIVAAVSRVLADAGCNLEDTSMTILRGHFAMMLVVAGPPGWGRRRCGPASTRSPAGWTCRSVCAR
ncbi:MAG: glycine cleavage system protein R [Actinomycetota bacterium]